VYPLDFQQCQPTSNRTVWDCWKEERSDQQSRGQVKTNRIVEDPRCQVIKEEDHVEEAEVP
jgi:hypothetical protein